MVEMKLLEAKSPANDYVVTVRNGQRLSSGRALPERLDDQRLVDETHFELLEELGLAANLNWPDPTPD